MSQVEAGAIDPRTRLMLEAPIGRTLLRLAVPNVAVMVAQAGVGLVETEGGGSMQGFVCTEALKAAREISQYGGWRHFVAAQ